MSKLKKHYSLLIVSVFFILFSIIFCPNVKAEKIKNEKDIDWSNPITVKIKNKIDIDTFTVEYQEAEFNISLFGIDVVKTLNKNNQKQTDYDNEYYTQLLRSNIINIELDSIKNKYNKNGEIQVWIWTDNYLFQNKLVSDGLALIDKGIDTYSNCNKYCSILKNSESIAKNSLKGLWGADKYDLNYNIGGNKVDNLNLIIIISSILILLLGGIIVLIVKNKRKNKINNKKEIINTKTVLNNETNKSNINQEKENSISNFQRNSNDELFKNTKLITNKSMINIKENIETEAFNKNDAQINVENKTLLLNVISTQFNTKDPRFKEIPETIKLEMVIVNDENLKSEKFSWFVKPMKYPKLTKYCKERCDVTQIDVNNGILFEDLVDKILPLMKKCDSIYSWGKSVLLQFQKEGKEKLMPEVYEKFMTILNDKYINYKEDFASRNEITPCSLIKAADLADQIKEKDAVDTMLNIYKLERM